MQNLGPNISQTKHDKDKLTYSAERGAHYIYLFIDCINVILCFIYIGDNASVFYNKNTFNCKSYQCHPFFIHCYFGCQKPQEVGKYVIVLYLFTDLKYINY